jgi:flagellar hook assembly protein FlgD
LVDGRHVFAPGIQRGYISIGGVSVEKETLPTSFSLSQNYPNPFNSSTEIEFALPQSGPVTLVIYDIQGREVRRLLDSDIEAGSHSVIWDGYDNSNEHVASGIYFYRLISDGASQTNRMTLLR